VRQIDFIYKIINKDARSTKHKILNVAKFQQVSRAFTSQNAILSMKGVV